MLAALTRIAARSICKQSAWQSATFSAAKFSASFASSKSPDAQQPPLSTAAFHQLADEALEEAASIFENAFETSRETDIHLAQGVLTAKLGNIGTFVLNKQPPNKQLWLSSPASGPRRFAWWESVRLWRCTKNDTELMTLLKREVGELQPRSP